MKTIFRSKQSEDYTILPNALLRDSSISFRSRGVLAMCLSSREDWIVTNQWLREQGTEGREALAASLKELEAAGYARFDRINGEAGRFTTQVWTFHDAPIPVEERTHVGEAKIKLEGEEAVIRQPVGRKATVLRQAVGTALPRDGKPAAKKDYSMDQKDCKEEIQYSHTPELELDTQPKLKVSPLIHAEAIYSHYPRKIGKPAAIKSILKALRSFPYEKLLSATIQFKKARESQDPHFTPHPATWFNQERFNDDPSTWVSAPRDEEEFRTPKFYT